MSETKTPFGLLFIEQVENQICTEQPEYDQASSISVIATSEGIVPFVEWEWNIYAATQTGTSTKQRGDEEDTDEKIRRPGSGKQMRFTGLVDKD